MKIGQKRRIPPPTQEKAAEERKNAGKRLYKRFGMWQNEEKLKKTVYVKADEYHSEYITNIQSENPMKDIGLNYIRFAETEKNLFRFLFQTNEFIGKNISELINSEELQPIIAILSKEVEVNTEQAKTIFRSLFLIAHGYASMFANNEMTYDEQTIISDLDLVFDGTVYSLKGGL